MDKHWSKDIVNLMASKLIIDNASTFNPDKAITRGDFVTYLLKGVGLYRTNVAGNIPINDKGSVAYRDAITTAFMRNIMTGSGGGVYNADKTLTREEAMKLIANTMRVVGIADYYGADATKFSDYSKISVWAQADANWIVNSKIMQGSNGKLNPKGKVTYAEAAAIVKNLMTKANLISK